MSALSAVILTFNEERNIGRCLDSVTGVVDEIIVVDSFSTDKTREICERYPVKFIQHPFGGYIEQKNYAAKCASNLYVISLDADEALSEKLRESILKEKTNYRFDGYTMNRLTNYCGKWIHHSGWYPDRKLRLFNHEKGKWGGVNPHDKYEMQPGATTNFLQGDILHYSYYSVEEHRKQISKFSEISAKALYSKGVRSNILKLMYKPVASFIRAYIVLGGFLDGKEGLIISWLAGKASWIKYHTLYKIQNENK